MVINDFIEIYTNIADKQFGIDDIKQLSFCLSKKATTQQ